MRLILKKENQVKSSKLLESLIHIISYAIILTLVSMCFKTIEIDKNYFGFYSLIASVIIYLLNKTIKPYLFRLTIPITGITMGLFYPCINVIILKLTDFILMNHFNTHGIITLFLTAALISFMNLLMDELIIKPIIRKGDKK